ncbi:MAG: dTDP-4-dehydrorhamnose 3,5-epimerase [Candidatus Kapaibacterium sp.]
MAFTIIEELLNGLLLIKPDVFGDDRGFFMEAYNENIFKQLGINAHFFQDNHSRSSQGVLRGLHFQWEKPMGKLIRVVRGSIQLVEVDIRPNSPTCGEHIMRELSEDNKLMMWIPPGFANGFLVTSDVADVQYKCSAIYNPSCESGIRWNDPALGINWGIEQPTLSPKDANAQTLQEWLSKPEAQVFTYYK